MIKHIVLWKLHDRTNAPAMKAKLDSLPAKIPAIHHLEAGISEEKGDALADIALYSEFRTQADLQAYIVHPAHQEVVAFIRPLVSERRVADYPL
ncbi:MAG TPA: stress responsive protein [Verrucomicrobia bacterium]|nr:stress responsive protein [Verrucomicrobiota bacterium]